MSPPRRGGRGHPGGQPDHDKRPATRRVAADSATQESRCHRRKIFIGGLSNYITTHELSVYFSRFGAIADAVVLRWPDGRPRGFGYVTFVDASAAQAALSTAHMIGGRQVDVKRAVPGTNKLFVGGLHQHTTASELCEHFEHFGSVSDAVVLMDPTTGRSRGFGFVCFVPGSEGSEAVKAAFQQYDKHRIRGKWIEVKCAVPPDRPADDEDRALSTGESQASSTPDRCVTPLGTPTQGSPRWGQSTPPRETTKVVTPVINALRRPRAVPASDEPKKVPLPSASPSLKLNLIAAIGLPPGLEAPEPAAVSGWPGCEPLSRQTSFQSPGSPPMLAITLKEMLAKSTFALECDDFAVAWGPGQRTSGGGCRAGSWWD
mmetsp:Transcript_113731/g.322060  ORF Transcript_113731/g.322060 Transcript_113731/m.322060 type:complete len:374 (-) Transcript_113731:43-1164(-)